MLWTRDIEHGKKRFKYESILSKRFESNSVSATVFEFLVNFCEYILNPRSICNTLFSSFSHLGYLWKIRLILILFYVFKNMPPIQFYFSPY